jgi:hypothetical protein
VEKNLLIAGHREAAERFGYVAEQKWQKLKAQLQAFR